MKLLIMKWILILILSGFAFPVKADCIYNGVTYPTGSTIGPYICSNDNWVKKP